MLFIHAFSTCRCSGTRNLKRTQHAVAILLENDNSTRQLICCVRLRAVNFSTDISFNEDYTYIQWWRNSTALKRLYVPRTCSLRRSWPPWQTCRLRSICHRLVPVVCPTLSSRRLADTNEVRTWDAIREPRAKWSASWSNAAGIPSRRARRISLILWICRRWRLWIFT